MSTVNSVGCTGNKEIDIAETLKCNDDRGNGGAMALIVKQLVGEAGIAQSSLLLDL